jgi:hypothetical protein
MSERSSNTPGRWATQQEAAQELGISTEVSRRLSHGFPKPENLPAPILALPNRRTFPRSLGD